MIKLQGRYAAYIEVSLLLEGTRVETGVRYDQKRLRGVVVSTLALYSHGWGSIPVADKMLVLYCVLTPFSAPVRLLGAVL